MSTFSFNPAIGKWVGQITEAINNPGTNSVYKNIKDFETQMGELVQPGVWTGAAAYQNYKNFDEALNAMIQFSNNFGNTFVQAMQEVTKQVANLEVSNLGADTNINGVLQDQTYLNMPNLAFMNATTEYVTYNVEKIDSIDAQLASIRSRLDEVVNHITSIINQLNSGNGELWDGESAQAAKENLSRSLNNGYQAVVAALNVCINNIKSASQAARSMNNQMGYAFNGSANNQQAVAAQFGGVAQTVGVAQGVDMTTAGLGAGVIAGAVTQATNIYTGGAGSLNNTGSSKSSTSNGENGSSNKGGSSTTGTKTTETTTKNYGTATKTAGGPNNSAHINADGTSDAYSDTRNKVIQLSKTDTAEGKELAGYVEYAEKTGMSNKEFDAGVENFMSKANASRDLQNIYNPSVNTAGELSSAVKNLKAEPNALGGYWGQNGKNLLLQQEIAAASGDASKMETAIANAHIDGNTDAGKLVQDFNIDISKAADPLHRARYAYSEAVKNINDNNN